MNYFINCNSIEEIKQLYRKLAMQYHPDKGGSIETMQEINGQYEKACKMQFHTSNFTAEEMNSAILDVEAYKEAINKVAPLDGITVELVGTWLWISGKTRQHKEILKTNPAKFVWAKKNTDLSAWFFRTSENKCNNKGAKMSLDNIRTKYGSQIIKQNVQSKLS